jgi:hypothetical protein
MSGAPTSLVAVAGGLGLAILLAWALRSAPAPASATGLEVRLPPIPLGGLGQQDAQGILTRLQPTIRPRLFPPGWTLTWPSVEIPTDFGTAKIELPPQELPWLPYREVEQLLGRLRPQLVNTEAGLAIQITASVPT